MVSGLLLHRSAMRAALLRLLLPTLILSSCALDPEGDELGVTCDGKCDGIGSLKSYIRDARELDLGDLVAVGSKFASDQLNDALAVSDYASIKVDEPRFFALPSVSEPDLTLENLDTLVSGLAARYGERELSTEVNEVRREHLMSSSDKVFVEAAFQVAANVNANWGESVGGFDNANVGVGFTSGVRLDARVIGAFASELSGVARAPLQALEGLRGFIFPRSLDEIRQMKPGESFALEGDGHLGVNLGAGVPILIANPGNAITYNIVISAGLRARLSGQLDVQLVRLDGDQIVIDVGMQKVREWSAKLAADDAWGVQGLMKTHLELGGIDVDLGRLVDKALQKQLNAKLHLFSAELSHSSTASRVSVARLRFHLDGGNPDMIAPAVAQALRGDVRLAQALANRGEPGVIAEFDLLRSGSSTTSYAGIDLLGMSFFKKTIASDGTVVLQTPGGTRSLLFDSLHKSSGFLFSEHGYTRVGLSGLNYDPEHPGEPRGEANLFVELQESDDFMERDKMLDHVDPMIIALAGPAAMHQIETAGNALERFVEQACPNSQAFDPCRVQVLSNPQVISLRQQGVDAATAAAGNLSPSLRDVLIKLATFRMTAQATYEPKASLVGPDSTWTVGFRFDDAALNYVMTERDATGFKTALKFYADAVGIDRIDPQGTIDADRTAIEGRLASTIDGLAAELTADQAAYKKFRGVEKAVVDTIGGVGPHLLEIHVPVDADSRPLYEDAVAGSLAEARSRVVLRLFDKLNEAASGFGTKREQVAGYALLSLLEPDRIDLRIQADMDLSDNASQNYDQYRAAGYGSFDIYGKGDHVTPIDGGLFSIDALIDGQ